MRYFVALLLVLLAVPASAQITIPNTFIANTRILSADVNENFTELGDKALNRTGGTLTGTLASRAITPTSDAVYDLGSASFQWAGIYATTGVFSSALTVTADGAATALNLRGRVSDEIPAIRFYNNAGSSVHATIYGDDADSGTLIFRTGTADTDRMAIKPGGLIIGGSSYTGTPNNALQVQGDSTVAADLAPYGRAIQTTREASNTGQHIAMVRAGNKVWSIGYVYNTNNFAIGPGQSTDSNFTATAAALMIDSASGAVNMPSQPAVLAQRTSNTSYGAGTNSVVFNSEVFDSGGNFSSTTFTAPVAGVYMVCAAVEASLDSAGSGSVQVSASGSGGAIEIAAALTTSSTSYSKCAPLSLAASETLTMTTTAGLGRTITIAGKSSPMNTFMAINLLK